MTNFVGAVVDLMTAPLPLFFIIIIVVMTVMSASNERKMRNDHH